MTFIGFGRDGDPASRMWRKLSQSVYGFDSWLL
jgi:hypothetical protein